jgi:hypothetical protein
MIKINVKDNNKNSVVSSNTKNYHNQYESN